MPKITNITGQRFGRLTALAPVKRDSLKRWFWRCKCDCGAETVASQNNLKFNKTRSCGCLKREVQKSIASRSPVNVGVDHYRWVADRSLVGRWRNFATRKWAARVLVINPGGCFKCGSNERLHVHHADGWTTHPHRRLDISNGVPLCAVHHREFHRLYGRDGSYQEDLHEYLGYPPFERNVIDIDKTRPVSRALARIFDLIMSGDLLAAQADLEREIWRLESTKSASVQK